mgnify:CR=1 FL=1
MSFRLNPFKVMRAVGIVAIVVYGAVLVTGYKKSKVNATESITKDMKVRNKNFYKEKYKEFKNTELKENIIFGDSRLVNLELEGYSNLSLGGVTLATLLENLEQYNDVKIKKMLVSLGVNDIISNYNKEIIKENYKKLLLETDKRNIELTLTTIGYALFRDSVDNEIVRELNEWLEEFTRENKIKLIDINKDLSEDYHLKYEYTNDGLHYNDEGTKILFNNLK